MEVEHHLQTADDAYYRKGSLQYSLLGRNRCLIYGLIVFPSVGERGISWSAGETDVLQV